MQPQQFEQQFLASFKPMTVSATLPSAPPYSPAMLWARDKTHHGAFMYCGCRDVQVLRNGQDVSSTCGLHGIQPLGKARRIRRNFVYARGVA